jgi:hypothetical protein
MKLIARIVLAASAAFSGAAGAQLQFDLTTQPGLEVQRLAPQLVGFAGGDVNFQNLATGLSLGLPVTLTTGVAPGVTQVVTFTPAGTLSPLQIAQTLEAVRQQLISVGVATPTAQQLGVALVGGTVVTPAGNVPVGSVVATNTALISSLQQASGGALLPGVNVGVQSLPRQFVGDSANARNISDTPTGRLDFVPVIPGAAGTTAGANAAPPITTTTTLTPIPNGAFLAPGTPGAGVRSTAPFIR